MLSPAGRTQGAPVAFILRKMGESLREFLKVSPGFLPRTWGEAEEWLRPPKGVLRAPWLPGLQGRGAGLPLFL